MGPSLRLFRRESCLYRDSAVEKKCPHDFGRWIALVIIILCMALLLGMGFWVIRQRRKRGGQALEGMGWMAPVGTVEPTDGRERDNVQLQSVHVDAAPKDPYDFAGSNQPPPPQYTPGNYFANYPAPAGDLGGSSNAVPEATLDNRPPAYPVTSNPSAPSSNSPPPAPSSLRGP